MTAFTSPSPSPTDHLHQHHQGARSHQPGRCGPTHHRQDHLLHHLDTHQVSCRTLTVTCPLTTNSSLSLAMPCLDPFIGIVFPCSLTIQRCCFFLFSYFYSHIQALNWKEFEKCYLFFIINFCVDVCRDLAHYFWCS